MTAGRWYGRNRLSESNFAAPATPVLFHWKTPEKTATPVPNALYNPRLVQLAVYRIRIVPISVQIPRILQAYAAGQLEFQLDGSTVGDLLVQLQQHYPQLYVCLCNEADRLRPHIQLFINEELVSHQAFETPVHSGDVLYVFQAVSGG